MRVRGPVAWLVAGCALLTALAFSAARLERAAATPPMRASLAVADAMSAESVEGFARASAPRDFSFPEDHGPHDGFRTEWWYFTGTLHAPDGRAFGYQLTFFRNALAPDPAPGASELRSQWVWLAHFALSDERGGRFRSAERLSREVIGLAGARSTPFRIWVEGWEATAEGSSISTLALRAAAEDFAIELELEPRKPVVLQGDRGLSIKGPEPGNASYYYSVPRLGTKGRVAIGDESYEVSGLSWLDREWSTSALGPELVGWDWLALQLDDGRDLMLYRLRRSDGGTSPFSAGSLIAADGTARPLDATQFELAPLGEWASPRGGRYPAGFRIRVPSETLTLEARPRLADQELDALVRYWEGAVRVEGRGRDGALAGVGFLEMTGYAAAPPASPGGR